eukprot:1640098-Prorocentrum_lima.AAC.1
MGRSVLEAAVGSVEVCSAVRGRFRAIVSMLVGCVSSEVSGGAVRVVIVCGVGTCVSSGACDVGGCALSGSSWSL